MAFQRPNVVLVIHENLGPAAILRRARATARYAEGVHLPGLVALPALFDPHDRIGIGPRGAVLQRGVLRPSIHPGQTTACPGRPNFLMLSDSGRGGTVVGRQRRANSGFFSDAL
jgi:hypothetical protein